MPHAIEIGLSPADDARVRATWARLRGITGSDYMATQVAIPHVALAVVENRPSVDDLVALVDGCAFAALDLELHGWGEFPGVVHWAVRRSPSLTRLHDEVTAALDRLGCVIDPHYRPADWVPHCTMAQHLDPAAQAAARRLMERDPVPRALAGISLALVTYPPARVVHRRASAREN